MTTLSVADSIADPIASEELLAVLRRYWGYDSFRPLQREAMEAIQAGRDSVVVLPTGGGKSLCFQAPSLVSEGLALVVSPLISLMKDQVDALRTSGVAAAALHSALEPRERDRVLDDLRQRRLKLLYTSPERLVGENGEILQRQVEAAGLRFVAIDEAHCISHWGHDFRPEYRLLGRLRERFPGVSLHAFTATATPRVQRDIVTALGLRTPEVLVGSFDRPNLIYRVWRRGTVYRQVLEVVKRHANEAGIVYCISRREVEALAERLQSEGHRALPYHAGLADEVRHKNQDAFANERVDVIVATVAFGMGIDRSNVRYVVHAGAPKSVEHYQQEAGRAGRDGLEADCILIYSPADIMKWRRLFALSALDAGAAVSAEGRDTEAQDTQLRQIERYAASTTCRHKTLVEHFGQGFSSTDCGACDRCLGELEGVEDATVLAQKILSGVARVREGFGAGHVIDVLRGKRTDKVVDRGHHELSTFGLLVDYSIEELRGYIEQLGEQGLLHTEGDRYPILRLTGEGRRLLRGEITCALVRQKAPPAKDRANRHGTPQRKGPSDTAGWEGVDRELFEALRAERLAIARERGLPPYVIFHDSTLRDLARRKPGTAAELLEVRGVGARKAEELGDRFLSVIRVFGH
ncbi:MAG: DNA helicase RecQ [Acidobacteriota bacterium]